MSDSASPDYSAPSPLQDEQELGQDQWVDVEMSDAAPVPSAIDGAAAKPDDKADMDIDTDKHRTNGHDHANDKPILYGNGTASTPQVLDYHLIRQEYDHLILPSDIDLPISQITSRLPPTIPSALPSFATTANAMDIEHPDVRIKEEYEKLGLGVGMGMPSVEVQMQLAMTEGLATYMVEGGVVRGLNGDLAFKETGERLVDLFLALREEVSSLCRGHSTAIGKGC